MAGNTIYVYDAFGQLAAEYNTFSSSFACTMCCVSTDQLGSVRLVTDQNGNAVTRDDYLPFGEEIPSTFSVRLALCSAPHRESRLDATDWEPIAACKLIQER